MSRLRKIIQIDEEKCNGCGACVPNCMEGALRIIDHKARLISDLFCDGLGACLGHCPEGAITIIEREAEPYDEIKVMEQIIPKGPNTIKAHLDHLLEHGANEYYHQAMAYLEQKQITVPGKDDHREAAPMSGGCMGSKAVRLNSTASEPSALTTWPIQLKLLPPTAPYLKNADLLIAADCAAFSYAEFHRDFMRDKVTIIGCPKLDDGKYYIEKLTHIFNMNHINSITLAHMEVPCCFGLIEIVQQAIKNAGKNIPLTSINISIKGRIL